MDRQILVRDVIIVVMVVMMMAAVLFYLDRHVIGKTNGQVCQIWHKEGNLWRQTNSDERFRIVVDVDHSGDLSVYRRVMVFEINFEDKLRVDLTGKSLQLVERFE